MTEVDRCPPLHSGPRFIAALTPLAPNPQLGANFEAREKNSLQSSFEFPDVGFEFPDT